MRTLFLGTVVMLLFLPRIAGAFDLVPLTVTPVLVEARLGQAASSDVDGVSLDLIAPPFTSNITSTVVDNAINFSHSISTTDPNSSDSSRGDVDVTLQVEVPYVGGAFTPVIIVMEIHPLPSWFFDTQEITFRK